MRKLIRLRSFCRNEAGTATVEFVAVLPAVIFLFFAGMETGLFMTRYVMFDRAVDMAMRDLRIGLIPNPEMADLKAAICDRTVLFENCGDALKIELTTVSQSKWLFPNAPIKCVDRSKPIEPALKADTGAENDIMLVRACITVDAIFPSTGVALNLPKDGNGGYFIAATSGFVNEP